MNDAQRQGYPLAILFQIIFAKLLVKCGQSIIPVSARLHDINVLGTKEERSCNK